MIREIPIKFLSDYPIDHSDIHLKHLEEYNENGYTVTFIDDKWTVIIIDLKEEEQTPEHIRMISGSIARELKNRKISNATIDAKSLIVNTRHLEENELVTAFIEGWELGSYNFVKYKSQREDFKTNITILNEGRYKEAIQLGKNRANAIIFSRNLLNEPSDVLNPETFPEYLVDEFKDTNVKVEVYNEKDIKEMKLNGTLAVSQGSKYSPSFIVLKYITDPLKPSTVLIGKGVTFDSGGVNVKTDRRLSNMRMDMGGASAVSGAIKLLEKNKSKVNVVGIMPIVENVSDNQSIMPGKVITYRNGKTVQVGNTDAEGRLILADALIYSEEFDPEYVVDAATLTGAMANALGSKVAGVFGDEELSFKLKEIGENNGDYVWPLPLIEEYNKTLKSEYADFSNLSDQSEAGAVTAALFLKRFVPESSQWLHIDMAAQMTGKESGYYGNTATGYGVRLLADYCDYIANK